MSSVKEAYQQLTGWLPNPMQEAVFPIIQSRDCALLLEAPTGSGKTEAILIPALTDRRPRRLFLIYPSRSLIEDQIARLERLMPRISAGSRRVALVIDYGEQSERRVWANGQPQPSQHRHLYEGDVILTTLDKFLYRFFGYGEPAKSYIFPFRIHSGAREPLFCFDEAHSYEDVAFSNFVDLVRTLYTQGLNLVVMTATLPPAYRGYLDFLENLNFTEAPGIDDVMRFYREQYPERNYPGKTLYHVSSDNLTEAMAAQANEWYSPGRRVILVVEEVRDAAEIYTRLREHYGDSVLFYHGRLPHPVRRKVYQELKRRDEQGERGPGYLLVTTSAIEVGCDLDAHVLITEICNPENLIQRAGRCNRRETIPDARVIVVGDRIRPYLRTLSEEDEGAYRAVLQSQNGRPMDVAAIRDCIHIRPQLDYRVQMLFRMLYEYVYEARRENRPLHEKGLVITRSWEPSLTLTTGIRDGHLVDPVTVSWTACATKNEKSLTPGCQLYRRTYNEDEGKWRLEMVQGGGGCAYFNDLVLVAPDAGHPELGYIEVPKVFLDCPASGYKHWLVYPNPSENQKPVWFWYIDRMEVSPEEEEEDADQHGGPDAGDE